MPGQIRVPINSDADTVTARQQGRALAAQLGLSSGDQALVATAISELARNIVEYAQRGEIILELAERGNRRGVVVIARDEGPGIPDIERAMQDGFTTGHGLGLGLPGARRLMDEFEIVSVVGKGTTVIVKKWAR
ncbi:MAG TPA: anti-sigma regulatory factor [Anaerolineae bacterium]